MVPSPSPSPSPIIFVSITNPITTTHTSTPVSSSASVPASSTPSAAPSASFSRIKGSVPGAFLLVEWNMLMQLLLQVYCVSCGASEPTVQCTFSGTCLATSFECHLCHHTWKWNSSTVLNNGRQQTTAAVLTGISRTKLCSFFSLLGIGTIHKKVLMACYKIIRRIVIAKSQESIHQAQQHCSGIGAVDFRWDRCRQALQGTGVVLDLILKKIVLACSPDQKKISGITSANALEPYAVSSMFKRGLVWHIITRDKCQTTMPRIAVHYPDTEDTLMLVIDHKTSKKESPKQ